MQTTSLKLKNVSKILTGLPIQRYLDKEDAIKQDVIFNKSIEEIDEEFELEEAYLPSDIKSQFYSKEDDILYKVQQQSFAKEITTEIGAVIPNTYIIIRVDKSKVNPKFLTNYLNDPRVDYEIKSKIDSTRIMKVNTTILKELNVILPEKEVQDKYATLISKVYERIDLKKKSIQSDKDLLNSLYDEVIGDSYER